MCVPLGEGKSWSKGKTAATDARIARSAAGHRGKVYVRRMPGDGCGSPIGAPSPAPIGWTATMAYVVGLIATDGCLIGSRRRIDFCSTDRQLVETYLVSLGRPLRFQLDRTRNGSPLYRAAIHDAHLYAWLEGIGLTPRKSLTLGGISVPGEHLPHLVRGLLDGDGSITNSISAADTTRRPDRSYQYEWFRVRFISASPAHISWLQERIRAALPVTGATATFERPQRTTMHRLQFGRWDSMRVLSWVYADRSAPCLLRKRAIWDSYAARHALDVAKA